MNTKTVISGRLLRNPGYSLKWRMKKDFIRLPSSFWQSEEIIPMKSVSFR